MKEVENKKETPETAEHPEKKTNYCRPRPHIRFTPRLKEVTKLLQSSFPKLFTRKPEPKYALKIGIYNDLLPWADKNNIAKDELGKALGFWCYGIRYNQALNTEKRYDLDFNETPFYDNTPKKNKMSSEATDVSTPDTSTKRKKITYPENWAEVYHRWKNKEISFKVAMELTGLKQSTFYKLAREYAEKNENP